MRPDPPDGDRLARGSALAFFRAAHEPAAYLRESPARRSDDRGLPVRDLKDILSDEADWAGLFYVKPVELDEQDPSPDYAISPWWPCCGREAGVGASASRGEFVS